MKRLKPAVVLLWLVTVAALPAFADKASSLYNKGRDAEARQDYETAYANYAEAYKIDPKNVRYRAAAERGKFLAAGAHVHRGQILRDSGKLQDALSEFEKAAAIDSSSFIAIQEVKRTRELIQQGQGAQPQSLNSTGDVLNNRIAQAAGPVDLAPITNSPITLRLAQDSKIAYETVCKLAGINVLFDPDYTSRQVNIQLNGVNLQDALQIIALESKTFWRPVTPNTIFVAADTPSKRKELEQNVVRTFYLSNLSQPTELQDLVNTIRTIVEVNRVQQLPTQGAVVVRGTPDQVALVQKLIDDIDKARPEVVVEIAVLQVSKTRLRNLGITPPSSVSATLQDNLTSATNTNNNNTNNNLNNTTGTTTPTTGSVNLNSLAHINATNFSLNIPSVTANLLFSDADSKLIQNPSIRAVDGQKATLKIGDRIPVATGSFQPGIGGVGINPLVNTQFNYIDVGVNIDVTPRIHANGEVSMKLVLDVSSVTGYTSIGGINQPTIGQRKVEHEIRLKDGEMNLLGGILQQENDKTLAGLPFLSQIPLLRYLFGSENVNKIDSEVVFAVIPHIVRGYDVSRSNTRAVDVGTGAAIQLSRVPVQPTPAATQGPAQMPQQPQQQPAQQPQGTPESQNSPAQGSANGALLSFDPSTVDAPVGSTIAVNVAIAGG
ncbi:MAG TPA: secretin N-terminal domain-containing protein, partial [Terriglobales bacterium]